jgi:hypothetical protein
MSTADPKDRKKPPRPHGLARPTAPSRRARHAQMSRNHFIGLVAAWAMAVAAILVTALLVR